VYINGPFVSLVTHSAFSLSLQQFIMLFTISKLSLFAAVALQGVYAAQNQLVQVTGNIGPNPNNVGMYVYRPSKVATSPALIVAIHYCTGTAQVRLHASLV
jgi:poly(3-hydroxybutyrate) depolymerase